MKLSETDRYVTELSLLLLMILDNSLALFTNITTLVETKMILK